MSNFLSNLAAKNLNLASVIQPRPLARFEPVSARRAMTTEAPIDPSALESVNTVESDAPRPLIVAPRQVPVVSSAPIEPPWRSAKSILRHSSPMPQPQIDPPAITLRVPEVQREVQHDIVNVTNVRSVVEQPGIRTATTERIIIKKDSMDRDSAASPTRTEPRSGVRVGLETTAAPLPAEDRTAIAPRPSVTPVIERIVHERERIAPDQAQPTRFEPVKPSTSAQPPEPEPPTIHVTIGRVEIHATSSAAPVKQPPRSASALSLDDYLRARNGGQR